MSFCNSTPDDMNLLNDEGLKFNSNTTSFGIVDAKPHKLAPVIGTTKNWEEKLDDSMVWAMRTMYRLNLGVDNPKRLVWQLIHNDEGYERSTSEDFGIRHVSTFGTYFTAPDPQQRSGIFVVNALIFWSSNGSLLQKPRWHSSSSQHTKSTAEPTPTPPMFANLIHRVTFVVVIGAPTGEHPDLVKMNLRPDTQLTMADLAGNSFMTTLPLRLFPGSDHDNSVVPANKIQLPKQVEGAKSS